jgi:TP53 regulating kinase-like protein
LKGNTRRIMCDTLTVNGAEYTVFRLLGKGKGGRSYLVADGSAQYVLKQIHHEPCAYYTFGDKLQSELRDYETLRRLGIPMPRLLAVDTPRERILKEYIAGQTVAELLRQGRMDPAWLAQVWAMCSLLYPAGLNIDYYPTNFVPWGGTLYYIDYECNAYMAEWDFEHWGAQYWRPDGIC